MEEIFNVIKPRDRKQANTGFRGPAIDLELTGR